MSRRCGRSRARRRACRFPDGIDADTAGNIYVSNQFAGVSEFSSAASGNVAPIATLSGTATGLSAPGRLTVRVKDASHAAMRATRRLAITVRR